MCTRSLHRDVAASHTLFLFDTLSVTRGAFLILTNVVMGTIVWIYVDELCRCYIVDISVCFIVLIDFKVFSPQILNMYSLL